jgi:hypothetical protein
MLTNKLILGRHDRRFSLKLIQARFLKDEETRWKTSHTSSSIGFTNGLYRLRLVKSHAYLFTLNVLKKKIKN